MKTFAEKVISFNGRLDFRGKLPENVRVLNPFRDEEVASEISRQFYKKFYSDTRSRRLILGINPGRFGAGITGIPFTDPKRVVEKCGIIYKGKLKHEMSSVFVYETIDAFGGVSLFYDKFYISSICPLGFTRTNSSGKEVNLNYYDLPDLAKSVFDFMIRSLRKQLTFGIDRELAICLGTGKNEKTIRRINDQFGFFKRIVALEHPRFVMQYNLKNKASFIAKYIEELQKS
jgi:hypothetical protein